MRQRSAWLSGPRNADYADEHDFCWLEVGRAALALTRDDVVRKALAALEEDRRGAELRLAILASKSDLRLEVLQDFLERLATWEPQLWRMEVTLVVEAGIEAFGLAPLSRHLRSLEDRFTLTVALLGASSKLRDELLRESLINEAWAVARTVEGDRDYALRHVIRALSGTGRLADAESAIGELRDPAIALDELTDLRQSLERGGESDVAARIGAERDQIAAAHPDTEPQSAVLDRAREMMEEDPPGGFPSDTTRTRELKAMAAEGRLEALVGQIKEHFATRFCPETLDLPRAAQLELMEFQLERVFSHDRNDLIVEYLVNANAGLPAEQVAWAAARLPAAQLELHPASPPSLYSRDPSRMTFDEFIRFVFDRPAARSDEEERFMRRSRDSDLSNYEFQAPANLASHVAEFLERFPELAPRFSGEQIEQGIWYLIGDPVFLWQFIMDADLPDDARVRIAQASRTFFADYVSQTEFPDDASGIDMWFDNYWYLGPTPSERFLQVLLATLESVLAMEGDRGVGAALEGLGKP